MNIEPLIEPPIEPLSPTELAFKAGRFDPEYDDKTPDEECSKWFFKCAYRKKKFGDRYRAFYLYGFGATKEAAHSRATAKGYTDFEVLTSAELMSRHIELNS